MRILHTSDWHIGKRLSGRDRLDEQRAALDEIAAICDAEKVDLVLVAGDVFDTFLPSAEAEDAFYSAAKKIAGTDRCMLIISGNHDDNIRLTAATALSEELGIYVYGNAGHIPKLCGGRRVYPVEAGANHIVFRTGEEEVFFNVLPYPNETRLKEDKNPDEKFLDKMVRWMNAGQAENKKNLPSVFLSHLFIAGGSVSEGEREIDLGGARAVPLSALPPCDYTALGHLHKRQSFKNNVVYSGSILQYAFDEAGTKKSVVLFDIGKEGVKEMRRVELHAGKQLVRLQANGVSDAADLVRKYPDCYIELTIFLKEPLLASQVRELREANPGIVQFLPQVTQEGEGMKGVSLRQLSDSELFRTFYRKKFAQEPSDDLTELFLSMTEGEDEA